MITADNARQVELATVGEMMLLPENAGQLIALCSDRYFVSEDVLELFRAVRDLHFVGAPIDNATVQERVGRDVNALIGEAGRAAYDACQHSDIFYYPRMLKRNWELHEIQKEASAMLLADTPEEISTHLNRMNGITAERRSADILSAGDAAGAFLERMRSKMQTDFIRFGLKHVDELLRIEKGDYIVIGGYTSAGKTMFALQVAAHIASAKRVGFLSLETSTAKLMDRLMSHIGHVQLRRIKDRDLREIDYVSLGQAAEDIAKLQIEFVPASEMTVSDMRAVALNRRYDVIIVDYLQIVGASGKSLYEQVTNISKDLHGMAQSNGITVIALAQLNRAEKASPNGKTERFKKPTLTSLRESGQIEQDADAVLLLYPEDIKTPGGRRVLDVAKNKDGELGTVMLDFDGAHQTFSEAKPTYSETMAAIRKLGKAEPALQPTSVPPAEEYEQISLPDPDLPF